MAVPLGRACLPMSKQLADKLEGETAAGASAGVAVPQVVKAAVLDLGSLADLLPGSLDVVVAGL